MFKQTLLEGAFRHVLVNHPSYAQAQPAKNQKRGKWLNDGSEHPVFHSTIIG